MKQKEKASSAGKGNLDENDKGGDKGAWDKTIIAAITKPEQEEKCIECTAKVFPSRAYGHTNAGPICSRTCNETHKERNKDSVGGSWASVFLTATV